jgi:hypothetical protein
MLARSKGLRVLIATLGLIGTVSAGLLMSPGAAQAHCSGTGAANTHTMDLWFDGELYARETPNSGTCNLSNWYNTRVYSFKTGWRASLWIQNNGFWIPYYGSSLYTPTVFQVDFQDTNSHTLIHLCVNDLYDNWRCGWDGLVTSGAHDVTHDYYGTNTLF